MSLRPGEVMASKGVKEMSSRHCEGRFSTQKE